MTLPCTNKSTILISYTCLRKIQAGIALSALLSLFLLKPHSSFSAERNYLDYHRQTVLIEGRLLGGCDDSTILSLYKNLFDEFEPFAREAIVALQLACRQKKTVCHVLLFPKSVPQWHLKMAL